MPQVSLTGKRFFIGDPMKLKLVISLLLWLVVIGATSVVIQSTGKCVIAQSGGWHPVKVHRDANGKAHFFEVWRPDFGLYEYKVLFGYANIAFAESDADILARLNRMQQNKLNFTRLWLRPSDGCY